MTAKPMDIIFMDTEKARPRPGETQEQANKRFVKDKLGLEDRDFTPGTQVYLSNGDDGRYHYLFTVPPLVADLLELRLPEDKLAVIPLDGLIPRSRRIEDPATAARRLEELLLARSNNAVTERLQDTPPQQPNPPAPAKRRNGPGF